jgi:hypothetical protein
VIRGLLPEGMRGDPQCERALPVPRVGRIFRIRDVVGTVRLSPARVKRLVWANGLVNAVADSCPKTWRGAASPGGSSIGWQQAAPGSGPKIHHRP